MSLPRTAARSLVALMALSVVTGACTSGTQNGPGPGDRTCAADARGRCIGSLTSGAVHLSMIAAQSELTTGPSLFTFGLTTDQGGLLTGGSPELWMAKDQSSKPVGPATSGFYQFTPDPQDKSPRSPLTGFYGARIDIPSTGRWVFAAIAVIQGRRHAAVQNVNVVAPGSVPAAVGSKAVKVATPVATTLRKLKEICTRDPPDHMHYISLDTALSNGKPTVVTFATPLLCESMLCGPVVDEELLVFQKYGPRRANFIHVEEFPPGPKLQPDPSVLPSYWLKWGFTTEPWTIVIDRHGIVRDRFEGPVTAAIIEQALKPLL